ncbi:GNAT family N-acetyltransferase [Actinoplanes sp. NPDC049596]|uniref:GNAT family N-acetyltransferase n=1 Tax=unclassified Actinoplanes TaxID=2626549 RepID=UPI00342B8D70
MSDGVSIRRAGANDVRELVLDPEDRHGLLDHLRHRRGILLFAFRRDAAGGAVFAGHIFIRIAPNDEPELTDRLRQAPLLLYLRVVDEHQRNGLGRRLVEEAERILARGRHPMVALGVDPENTRAIAFYESLSFTRWRDEPIRTHGWAVREDGGVEQVEEDCLIYQKLLPGPETYNRAPREAGPGI